MANKIFDDNSIFNKTANYPLEIISYDGLYPLLRFPYLIKGSFNPYFSYIPNHSIARISGHIQISSNGHVHKYGTKRRESMTFYSGYFSVIGLSTGIKYLPSSLKDGKLKIYGIPDIFCIGVVKTSKLPKFSTRHTDSRYFNSRKNAIQSSKVEVNTSDVTILISKEKLRKAKFAKENYTITARNEILYQLNRLDRLYGDTIKFKDVSDEYLRNFYTFPESIRTNSIVETMQIEQSIKEEVFSNLNSILI